MIEQHRNYEKEPKRINGVLVLVVLNLLIWGSAITLWMQAAEVPPEATLRTVATEIVNVSEPTTDSSFEIEDALSLSDVDFTIASNSALLLNLDTGEILFNHRAGNRVYPASITKIMTVLIGLEYADGQDMYVQANFDELFAIGASLAGFAPGERRTLSEILHGTLLASGADATSTLAYSVAGSYVGFVDLMNNKARSLGMENTNFMNASGLHHEDQYTTAYDIAILLDYALTYPEFRSLFTTQTYDFISIAGFTQTLTSTMFRLMDSRTFRGGRIIGGKTGFTTPAGLCLASLATDGNDEFILLTFGAPSDQNRPLHIDDAMVIYEYFFN